MDKPLGIGICGLGTVGQAVVRLLREEGDILARRAPRALKLAAFGLRRDKPGFDPGAVPVYRDMLAVARDPNVDVVVELMGGTDDAKALVELALTEGKAVVTANKALLSEHGDALFALATQQGVPLAYEASVAGGIPIIKALREGLAGNRIEWVAGIINGTSNFILTEMAGAGRPFADVLAEAQRLGYAEADPTFDVEGIDAAHKLSLLASLAFGVPIASAKVFSEGLSRVTPDDFRYAEAFGYRIKPLALARRRNAGLELRVHPALVSEKTLFAQVQGVQNAVMIGGHAVGPTLYVGAGAGGDATASAVVADLMDLARGTQHAMPPLAYRKEAQGGEAALPSTAFHSPAYLRIVAEDTPGVLAQVATILSSEGINIEALMQKAQDSTQEGETTCVPIVLLTRAADEAAIDRAIAALEALPAVRGAVLRLRVEPFAAS